mmetsp:Transcript_29018/g.85870  ORF Transcript_29018/g.85870 Transcript_29018/m.85870 type:complete len:304 (+) Transcript_29018:274-1185(+)
MLPLRRASNIRAQMLHAPCQFRELNVHVDEIPPVNDRVPCHLFGNVPRHGAVPKGETLEVREPSQLRGDGTRQLVPPDGQFLQIGQVSNLGRDGPLHTRVEAHHDLRDSGVEPSHLAGQRSAHIVVDQIQEIELIEEGHLDRYGPRQVVGVERDNVDSAPLVARNAPGTPEPGIFQVLDPVALVTIRQPVEGIQPRRRLSIRPSQGVRLTPSPEVHGGGGIPLNELIIVGIVDTGGIVTGEPEEGGVLIGRHVIQDFYGRVAGEDLLVGILYLGPDVVQTDRVDLSGLEGRGGRSSRTGRGAR